MLAIWTSNSKWQHHNLTQALLVNEWHLAIECTVKLQCHFASWNSTADPIISSMKPDAINISPDHFGVRVIAISLINDIHYRTFNRTFFIISIASRSPLSIHCNLYRLLLKMEALATIIKKTNKYYSIHWNKFRSKLWNTLLQMPIMDKCLKNCCISAESKQEQEASCKSHSNIRIIIYPLRFLLVDNHLYNWKTIGNPV